MSNKPTPTYLRVKADSAYPFDDHTRTGYKLVKVREGESEYLAITNAARSIREKNGWAHVFNARAEVVTEHDALVEMGIRSQTEEDDVRE